MIRVAALLVLAAAGPAAGPSEAVDMASRSGIVIGAAGACRVDEGRLIALGRVIIGQIRDAATSRDDLRVAQRAHEDAVTFGDKRIRAAGPQLCPAAEARFGELERACLSEARPRCAMP